MRIEFRCPVNFGTHSFSKGVHEVSEEAMEHPFFAKLVEAGLAIEPDSSKLVKQETIQERSERIAAILKKQAAEKLEAAQLKAMEPKEPDNAIDVVPEDDFGDAGPNDEDFSQETEADQKESSPRKTKKKR